MHLFFVNLIWITNFYALIVNLGVCNMSKIPLVIYYLEQCYNEGKFKEISLKRKKKLIFQITPRYEGKKLTLN